MSCLACAQTLDCANPPDSAPSLLVYPTQGYSIPVNCPPGYVCQGQWPHNVVITEESIPPVPIPPVPPGAPATGTITLKLQGCIYLIVRNIPANSTQAFIERTANAMQQEWAQQQAQCIPPGTPSNPYPAPVRRPPHANCFTVQNTSQTATASCPNANCGPSVSKTVAAGTYTQLICSEALRANTVASLNAQAYADALAQATAVLSCTGGNAFTSGNGFCPGQPQYTIHVEIPPCTYYEGGDVDKANAKANADMIQQIHDGLAAMGCICPGPVAPAVGYGVITTNGCPVLVTFDRINRPPFILPASFDPAAQYLADTGLVLHGQAIITAVYGNWPPIVQWYP